jgi:AcrR family transcriptional regulator
LVPVCRGANPEPYWLIIRLRRCLATWALAAARGVQVRKVLSQRGWSKSTFYRKLDGGAARIAAILGERGDLITYLRLLDADVEGADWREVARIVLHLDPEHESDRARRAFDSHLSRAKWMTEHGYRHLLRGGASA